MEAIILAACGLTAMAAPEDVISVIPGQLVLHSCHFEADLKSPFVSRLVVEKRLGYLGMIISLNNWNILGL